MTASGCRGVLWPLIAAVPAIAAVAPQDPDRAEWLARAEALVKSPGWSEADAAAALELLPPFADLADPHVQQARYKLATKLVPFAGHAVADAGGATVDVPDAVVVWEWATHAADLRDYGVYRVHARTYLAQALDARGDRERARQVALETIDIEETAGARCLPLCFLAELALLELDFVEAKAMLDRADALLPTQAGAYYESIRAHVIGAWGDFELHLGKFDAGVIAAIEEAQLAGETDTVAKREIDQLIAADRFEAAVVRAATWEQRAAEHGHQDAAEHARLLGAIAAVRLPDRRDSATETLRGFVDGPFGQLATDALAFAAAEAADWQGVRRWLDLEDQGFAGALAPRRLAVFAAARMALAADGPVPVELENQLEWFADRYVAGWGQTEPDPGGVGFLDFRDRRDLLSLLVSVRVRRHGDGVDRAFADMLRFRDLGAFTRRSGLGPSSLAQAQALVPEGGLAVAWVMGHAGSHVFVLDGEVLSHYPAPSETPTLEMAREFRSLVLRPDVDMAALQQVGLRVRERVLPTEVWKRVAAVDRLLLIGGHDWGLPFEALPGERERFLGWSHAVVHVPSVAVGAWLARRELPERIERGVLDAALTPWPGLPGVRPIEPLRIERHDLDRLVAPLASASVTVGTLDGATARAPADYRVVLAHGLFDRSRPRGAGLVIGEAPGVLWSEDLEAWGGAPWTVLAACGAARGGVRRGEDGGHHLGAACFASGASTVLLANADLEVSSTLALLEAFHREMAIGNPIAPAEALRRARRAVGSEGRFAAPQFHGLLMVTGRGFDPVTVAAPPSGRLWWWWLAGAVVLVAAVAVRRRRAAAG